LFFRTAPPWRGGTAEQTVEADPDQVLEITFANGGVL